MGGPAGGSADPLAVSHSQAPVNFIATIMIVMINDALQHRQLDDEQYNSYLRMIEAHKPGKLLQIFVDAGDKAARNAERKLLFDAISYEIISYI